MEEYHHNKGVFANEITVRLTVYLLQGCLSFFGGYHKFGVSLQSFEENISKIFLIPCFTL
jgi:hypothetical protein